MLVVRPARTDDIDAFLTLAQLSGPGFTSLPPDRAPLLATLERSVASFADPNPARENAHYVLMLEDGSGRVCGCAGVKAAIGVKKPFFSLRLVGESRVSQVVDRRLDTDVLMVVNDFAGATEVGTLFVHPDMRGQRAGELLAKARYLLIASAPERFADTVIAELRGRFDAQGSSPFWESFMRKFFQMDFEEADELNAKSDNQFIVDLMPRHPVYVDVLPEAAREVIGQVHPDGERALALLTAEGFRYDRVIDIFDGGPLVSAVKNTIATLRQSRTGRLAGVVPLGGEGAGRGQWCEVLIGPAAFGAFRLIRTTAHVDDLSGDMTLTQRDVDALGVGIGDPLRMWRKP